MNFEYYIASRLVKGKGEKDKKGGIGPVVKITVAAIAMGLAVMILSVAIVVGFKQQIRDKVIGFAGHLNISNFDSNSAFVTSPVDKNQPFYPDIVKTDGVKHIQVYAVKPGIIKTKTEIQGVVLKGIGSDYDHTFIKKNLIQGKTLDINDTSATKGVLISKYIASLLNLKNGDDLRMYFIQDANVPPKGRKFKIEGIYETGLEEYDKLFVLCDIKHLQRLYQWNDNQVSGFEVIIDDFDRLADITYQVRKQVELLFYENGSNLNVNSIIDNNKQIFDWLKLIDTNVWVILILMTTVAGFNIVAGLLIMIIERTNLIGLLKALGTYNLSIRKIFLYQALYLVLRGILWGNLIGVGMCVLQLQFGIIKLDPASYYVNSVPINLNLFHLLLLNIGTFFISIVFLIVPSYIATRIDPAKAIQYS